jgi:hypothetical protein
MKKRPFSPAFVITLMVLFASCIKESKPAGQQKQNKIIHFITKNPLPANGRFGNTDLAQFMSNYGAPLETFIFDADILPVELSSNYGTTIRVPANSLRVNGQPVTSGQVAITLRESFTRSSLIASGFSTMSKNDGLLESAGQFLLDITVNNVPADRNLTEPLELEVNYTQGAAGDVSLWSGDLSTGTLRWGAPAQLASGTGVNNFIPFNGVNYIVPIPALGWTNLDKPIYFQPMSVALNITLDNSPGDLTGYAGLNGNAVVYFIPQGRNAAMQLYTRTSINTFNTGQLFTGAENGRLFAFAVQEGKYYLAEKEVTITDGMNITLQFTEVGEAGLVQAIRAMDWY